MKIQPVNDILSVTDHIETLPLIVQFPLTSERPCINFVNTIDWRLTPDLYHDALDGFSALLAFALRLSIISTSSYSKLEELATSSPQKAEETFSAARAFRNALITIIDDIAGTPSTAPLSVPRAEALEEFNRARVLAHESESLSWREGHMVLIHQRELEGFDQAWLPVVRDAEELLLSPLSSRIRVCAAEGCGWAFIDTSKNGKRKWCSMQICGNREKARRFKTKDMPK